MMEEMQFIVKDLNDLIAKYGISQVKHALSYIDGYPVRNQVYAFNDSYGNTYMLTPDNFNRVKAEYANGLHKIQAIKIFREITSCGLKEAKEAIERYNW